jgi:hypothetical protein
VARLSFLAALCIGAILAMPARPASAAVVPVAAMPKVGHHARYIVEVNAKGQVSGVRSRIPSKDQTFDAITYGNVVQTFIRRSDGRAIAGVYRVAYDYDPKTGLVKRSVKLIQAGGVDASALGLVDVFRQINIENEAKIKAQMDKIQQATPSPGH